MGNCQAIDAASLVIQHPNGKIDKMYTPISVTQVMKLNPGHYVALLITTTICHTTKTSNNSPTNSKTNDSGRNLVRITRVKLLRPNDTLALGHVYRLISSQEVMKELVAKKQAKMKKSGIELADSDGLKEAQKLFVKKSMQDKTQQQQVNRQASRSTTASGGTGRPKTWQPSLNSISEATS